MNLQPTDLRSGTKNKWFQRFPDHSMVTHIVTNRLANLLAALALDVLDLPRAARRRSAIGDIF